MALKKLTTIEMHCELGPGNGFRFVGRSADSEAVALGSGRQKVDLFRNLLKRLAEVYPEGDGLVVEVDEDRIVEVPQADG